MKFLNYSNIAIIALMVNSLTTLQSSVFAKAPVARAPVATPLSVTNPQHSCPTNCQTAAHQAFVTKLKSKPEIDFSDFQDLSFQIEQAACAPTTSADTQYEWIRGSWSMIKGMLQRYLTQEQTVDAQTKSALLADPNRNQRKVKLNEWLTVVQKIKDELERSTKSKSPHEVTSMLKENSLKFANLSKEVKRTTTSLLICPTPDEKNALPGLLDIIKKNQPRNALSDLNAIRTQIKNTICEINETNQKQILLQVVGLINGLIKKLSDEEGSAPEALREKLRADATRNNLKGALQNWKKIEVDVNACTEKIVTDLINLLPSVDNIINAVQSDTSQQKR